MPIMLWHRCTGHTYEEPNQANAPVTGACWYTEGGQEGRTTVGVTGRQGEGSIPTTRSGLQQRVQYHQPTVWVREIGKGAGKEKGTAGE